MSGTMGGRVMTWLAVLAVLAASARAQVVYRNDCNAELQNPGGNWVPPVGGFTKWEDLVPDVDGVITIPCGEAVQIGEDTWGPTLQIGGLIVDGLLIVRAGIPDTVVTTRFVLIRGKLEMGTPEMGMGGTTIDFVLDNGGVPMDLYADPSFLTEDDTNDGWVDTDPRPSGFFGDQAFIVFGGEVEMYGIPDTEVQSNLAYVADTIPKLKWADRPFSVTLQGIVDWQVGDEIVIASSGTARKDSEYHIIKAISINEQGNTVVNTQGRVKKPHLGRDVSVTVKDTEIDMAAEVIRLSRGIVIRGADRGTATNYGGHVMVAHTALRQVFQGVRFTKMGQRNSLGRYPWHQHMGGPNANTLLQGCVVDKAFHRGMVIHGTHKVKLYDNFLYKITGHAILVGEDGWEMYNRVVGNVIIWIDLIELEDVVANGTDQFVTGIWVSNPKNTIDENIVISSEISGVWFEMRAFIVGVSAGIERHNDMIPSLMSLTSFKNNIVHSNHEHGVRLYPDRWVPNGNVYNVVDGLKSYMNRGRGVFLNNGFKASIINSILVDNQQGAIDFERQMQSHLANSIVVGRSELSKNIYYFPCSFFPAVEFHNRVNLDRYSGSYVQGVVFDGMAECLDQAPVIRVDGNDDKSTLEPFSSGTSVIDCEFLDADPALAYSLKQVKYSGHPFRKFVAVSIINAMHPSITYDSAYLVPSFPFMEPQGIACDDVDGGVICPDTCYRSIGFGLYKPKDGVDYTATLIRGDGEYETIVPYIDEDNLTKVNFWFTLREGEQYGLVLPDLADNLPVGYRLKVGDYDRACGEVKFSIWENGFQVKAPFGIKKNTIRMATRCSPIVETSEVHYYNDCDTDGTYEQIHFVIPKEALPSTDKLSQREVAGKFALGTGGCPTYTSCPDAIPFPEVPTYAPPPEIPEEPQPTEYPPGYNETVVPVGEEEYPVRYQRI